MTTEEYREYKRVWRQKNKEKISASNRKYYLAKNPNASTELNKTNDMKEYQRLYYQEHKKERAKYRRLRRANNDLVRLSENLRATVNRGFKTYIKNKHTEEILGCSFEEFRLYIEKKFKDGMTWENYGEWELDHIIPISSASTEEEVYKLNHYTNFQPLWLEENRKKGDKIL